MGKNNFTERSKKTGSQNKQEHFSIRKLTVGAASVLIGFGFVNANNQVVKADAQKPDDTDANVQSNNQEKTAASSADQQQASANTAAGIDTQTHARKHSQAAAGDQTQAKLSTFNGLTSFLRDATPETPKESEEGAVSAPSSSAAQQPEDTAEQSKKVETEQKLNAAATSLNTALNQAKTISNSDKYKQDTQERQEALQAAVTQAQTVANKYHDLGSSPLSEDDQTKLLADITAASDKLTALLSEYTAEKEQVEAQDGISLRSNSGHDGDITWTYTSGTLTFTGSGTLSSTGIQYLGVSVGDITKIVFSGPMHAIKLAADSSHKFTNLSNVTEIDGLTNLDTSAVTDMSYMFSGVNKMTTLDLSGWNTSSVLNMSHMFEEGYYNNSSKLSSIIFTGWDTSHVTDMSYMFSNRYGLQDMYDGLTSLDLSALNTSSVTNMSHMFSGDRDLTGITFGSAANWDTSNVTDMSNMFDGDQKLQTANLNIVTSGNYWKTSSVKNMCSMFSSTGSITSLDLSTWDTSSVTTMNSMFSYTNLTSLDLHTWDTSSVTDMSSMFYYTDVRSLDLHTYTDGSGAHWDTKNVTDMDSMFNHARELSTLDLTGWDTSKVIRMDSMFYYCDDLGSIDGISAWDTSKVKYMGSMFYSCARLTDLDLHTYTDGSGTHWDTSSVIDMAYMFQYCSSLGSDSGSLNISTWNTSNVTSMGFMFYGCKNLTSLSISTWNISKVQNMVCMFLDCSGLTSLNLITDTTSGHNYWNIGANIPAGSGACISMTSMFAGCSGLTKLKISNWNTARVNGMDNMFSGCSSLKTASDIDISSWDVSNVTDMSYMFHNCSQLQNLNINNWHTGNVAHMEYMFSGCTELGDDGSGNYTLNIGTWDTSRVQDMHNMFSGCSSLHSLDLHAYTDAAGSHWNPCSVTNMSYMFDSCSNLQSLSMSTWDTGNMQNMSYMFNNCALLNNLDLHTYTDAAGSHWNTAKVSTMEGMFDGCTTLNDFNFKGWDTSTVANMSYMFKNCTSLTGTKVAQEGIAAFDTSAVTTMAYMFAGDSSIKDLILAYNAGNLNDMSYMFSGMYSAATSSPISKPETGVKYIDITAMNTSTVIYMSHLFDGDQLLNNLNVNSFNTDFAEDMSYMFNDCRSLTSDGTDYTFDDPAGAGQRTVCLPFEVKDWITRFVSNMSYMFAGDAALTTLNLKHQDTKWDTSNVASMQHMFDGDTALTSIGDVSSWDTSSAQYMTSMFKNDKNLVGDNNKLDLSGWNTSSVLDMRSMFNGDEALTTLKLGPDWNTSNVGNTPYNYSYSVASMFNDNKNLTTIDNNGAPWGTAKVIDMSNMFNGDAKITNLDFVDSFVTGNVTNMQNMFNGNSSLTGLDLHTWNTSSVENMSNMFNGDAALTTLTLGPNWHTGNVSNLQNMFNSTKKLKKLDISAFDTGSAYSNMQSMFNNLGADSSVQSFVLTLGHFKINDNAWGDFKWKNIRAMGTSQDFDHPAGNVYTLDEFKSLYNPSNVTECPNTETYVLQIHDVDNKHYTAISPVVVKAHTGQTDRVTDQYQFTDILSFTDNEDSNTKTYSDLLAATDNIVPSKKVIQSAEWRLAADKKYSMDQEGNVKVTGGVLDENGRLIPGAKNTPGLNLGNAVIRVKYGDNTEANVPVKVELPDFVPGPMQEVTRTNKLPTVDQAKAALKTSDTEIGPDEWGKSNLTYSWIKGEHDLTPLQDSDLGAVGDHHVAIKVTYTTAGHSDGYEVVPVTLLVKKYNEEFPISTKIPITTHAVGSSSTLSVVTPGEFSKSNLAAMKDLITITDIASGYTSDNRPHDINVDNIISSLDWASGSTPTFIDNGNGTGNDCHIIAHYTDNTDGAATPVKVHVIGGQLNSAYNSGITLNVGHALPPIADALNPASVLTPASVTAINSHYNTVPNTVKYNWSTSPDRVVAPDISTGGAKNVYAIIDYGDGTTQAVPVTINVTDTSTLYSGIAYDGTLTIHAADDSTAAPTLDLATMKTHFTDTEGTPPTTSAIPSSSITGLEWATETNSVPDYTSGNIGAHTGKMQIIYTGNSVSAPFNINVNVEGATAVSSMDYSCGDNPADNIVPSAADFLDGTNGTKAPASYGLHDTDYKWVDAVSHQELTLAALHQAKGIIAAAIEVDYHDGTHQYLPVTLNLQTVAAKHSHDFTPVRINTHVGKNPNKIDVYEFITNSGSLVRDTDYQIVWANKPDTTVIGLKDDGTKDVNAAALITFVKDGSQLTVSVPGTVSGAVLKNSDTAKTLYLNDAALSAGQQADITNYYVNSSSISGYTPTYTIELDDSAAAIKVHYSDGIVQELEDVPLKVIKPATQRVETYQGNPITAQQVLANYSELAGIAGMTITNELSGINFNQTGTQTGYVNLNYTADDPAFSDFNGSFAVPVTVKVNVRPVDNSMAANFHPNGGGVQVPQYTDLPSHNNYADQAVTNANEMPAGTNYTWDTTSTADTSTKDKTDKTFVTVHYPDGSVGSIPVKVNVSDPQESDIVLKHNAYLYDEQGKRVNGQTLQSGSTVKTYGTALINKKMYYIIEADKYYIKASNVAGRKRKLDSTAHVYDKYGQQTNDQVIYAGTAVTTYGTPVMIKGQKYYLIDNNKYVPADNFPPASDTWIDPTVHGSSDTSGGVKKETMHAAYFYNKNGKRKSKAILKAGSSVVTYGKTTIKHKQYYVLDNDEFLLANNIDPAKRYLSHGAEVVDRYGKATGKKLHKGSKVSVYGKAVKIKGVSCYVIGDNQYVKASKLK
ncbi:BspA family leucine-rich repeat surface protein [Lactobacillus sp. ESL0791]|uniref:BspA family leucine-rich repeat surface protein n=1 Tax=Lactobacillus sp. ESL0791 TaxID=2983234 RepID=UPI0023F9DB87|nr:BspA family leucine-rich repeat surface protein [Lactobacillus sp. ESL0791]MDF7639792.1 BspA family leucine-rich repeat surface protein [Lactobacillus sp. ESL0791]